MSSIMMVMNVIRLIFHFLKIVFPFLHPSKILNSQVFNLVAKKNKLKCKIKRSSYATMLKLVIISDLRDVRQDETTGIYVLPKELSGKGQEVIFSWPSE